MRHTHISTKSYIPGLDGLRALAVIAVILYHLSPATLPGGYLGVDIFFVISGFLITTLLFTEKARHGSISLGRFWIRRARRLLPALGIVVLTTASLALIVGGDVLVGIGRQIFGAATFSSNWVEVITGTNYFSTTHPHIFLNFWSLAVEEQFYLVWPFIVFGLVTIPVIRRYRWSGVVLALALSIGSAVWMSIRFHTGDTATRVYYGTDTHLFGLMIGATLAFISYARERGGPPRRLMQPFVSFFYGHKFVAWSMSVVSLTGLIILMFTVTDQGSFTYTGGLFLANLLAGLLLVSIVGARTGWQRLFENPFLKWIGVRSYGLYLWHYPLIVLTSAWLPVTSEDWIIISLVLVGTIVAAALSYRFVEQPIRAYGVKSLLFRQNTRLARTRERRSWRFRPLCVPLTIGAVLTITAIIVAPHHTVAEQRIDEGRAAIHRAKTSDHSTEKSMTSVKRSTVPAPDTPSKQVPEKQRSITGKDMTLVGDSVSLASAPELIKTFPDISIHASVSTAFRTGGLAQIDTLKTKGELRKIVVIAQATNGYYGTGSLERLVKKLSDHYVVLVTAYGDRGWIAENNDYAKRIAKRYTHVVVAPWDTQIREHKSHLASDGIHPDAEGGVYYAKAIKIALQDLSE